MTIAIIDGDAAVRDSFHVLLDGVGYDVKTFESGMAFLSALPDSSLRCVLAATGLPDLSLPDLILAMRDASGHIPTIAMCDHMREFLNLRLPETGFTAFLQKPIDEGELFAHLEDALSSGLLGDGGA